MKNWVTILLICIAFAVLFWLGAIIVANYFGFVITDQNVILTFVGILATFIIISNYEQVQTIEKQTNEQIKKLENKLNGTIKILEEHNKNFSGYLYEIFKESDVTYSIIVNKILKEDFSELYYMKGEDGFVELTKNKYEELLKTNPNTFIFYEGNGFFILKKVQMMTDLAKTLKLYDKKANNQKIFY